MSAFRFRRKPVRRRWLLGGTLVLTAAVFLLVIASASGLAGSPSKFESSDGNMKVNTTGNADWNSLSYDCADKTKACKVADVFSSTADDSFVSGQKQDTTCPDSYTHKNPNKDDFTYVASYAETNTTAGSPQYHHTFLYGATIRYAANGSASENVELKQGKNGNCTNGLLARTKGDKLIAIDYTGGGSNVDVHVLTWIVTTDPTSPDFEANNPTCNVSNDPAPCWGSLIEHPSSVEGSTNNGFAIPANENGLNGAALVSNQFAEFGVDLTAAGIVPLPEVECRSFPETDWESRSSGSSFVSTTKDVAKESHIISACGSVNVLKVGNDGGSQEGAVFTLYKKNNSNTYDSVGTCTVDATGQCGDDPSFSDLGPADYRLDETTIPDGYSKDASLPFDFTLALSQDVEYTFTDVALPGEIAISKVDDHGDPVSGIVFTASQGGTEVGSCTTDATGACTIDSLDPGTYSVDETVASSTGYIKDSSFPQDVTVTAGNAAVVSATNPRAFKAIVLVCRQYDSTLYPSSISIDGGTASDSESRAALDTFIQTWATAQGLGTLTTVQKTAFETAVCSNISAGAASGLRAADDPSNPHSADIDIPN
jgi:uncharacterized surface anchored protein